MTVAARKEEPLSELIVRSASLVPGSVKEEDRTVDIVWTTGARVKRYGWEVGAFIEELVVSSKAVDLKRLNSGAPLLNAHSGSQDALRIMGAVVPGTARITDGQGTATVRFDDAENDPDAEKVFRKIQNGIIRGVSVGYMIHEVKRTKEEVDGVPVFRVTKWEPFEVSVAPIPADIKSSFRSFSMGNNSESNEPDTNSVSSVEQVRAQELERMRAIRMLCTRGRLGDALADELINSGISLDAARAQILERYIASNEIPSFGPNPAATGRDLAGESLRSRTFGARDNVSDRHSEIVKDVVEGRMGAIELARTVVLQSGEALPSNNSSLIKRALSTSDFPLVLTGAVGASLRRGYENEPASHVEWVRFEPVKDFKLQERPILGAAPDLKKKNEGGEYEQGSFDEDGTSYKIATYGRIVKLTREVLVNDWLGAWLRLFPALGQAARRKEADLIYSMFAENGGDGPTMQDGNPLFDAAHNNVTDVAAFGVNQLAAGRLLLRKQTGVGGGILGIRPAALVVPAEVEHQAELLLAAASRVVSSTLESDVSPWIRDLKLVVEPRLAATAGYLVGDRDQIDSAVLGLLEGEPGPHTEEEIDFATDTKSFKVRQDMGAKVLDWRGIVKMVFSA